MKNDNAPTWQDFKYRHGCENSFLIIGGHRLWVETVSGGRVWWERLENLERRKLKANTLSEAKREALGLLADHFDGMAQQARKAIEEVEA